MSRKGKREIVIPQGVEVKKEDDTVFVKGPKGALSQQIMGKLCVTIGDGKVKVTPESDDKETMAKWGLYRVLIDNMVIGVSAGFQRRLNIVGVGYRAEMKGKDLNINIGFSHPVLIKERAGVAFSVEKNNVVVVTGIDKQVVGQAASDIRKVRPPEPYKGKGIRYEDEQIIKKAGKAGVAG